MLDNKSDLSSVSDKPLLSNSEVFQYTKFFTGNISLDVFDKEVAKIGLKLIFKSDIEDMSFKFVRQVLLYELKHDTGSQVLSYYVLVNCISVSPFTGMHCEESYYMLGSDLLKYCSSSYFKEDSQIGSMYKFLVDTGRANQGGIQYAD